MDKYIKIDKPTIEDSLAWYNKQKACKDTIVANEGTDNECIFIIEDKLDSFSITALSREDFENRGWNTSELTDKNMRRIAEKMGESYVSEGSFWDDLDFWAEEYSCVKRTTREEVEEMFGVYVKVHGHEPNYARVTIRWKDDKELCEGYIFRLWDDYPNDNVDDDTIFYYCSGLNDLCSFLEEGVEDFIIVRVNEFFDEL